MPTAVVVAVAHAVANADHTLSPGDIMGGAVVVDIMVSPLSVPLRDPFVIATGRIDTTCAVLVEVVVQDRSGRRGRGLGEAAALPPVTPCNQADLLRWLTEGARRLMGHGVEHAIGSHARLQAAVDHALAPFASLPGVAVARSGLESALLFAWADLLDVGLHRLLGGSAAGDDLVVVTDITIPIGTPDEMARLARGWARQGFGCFKLKVGRGDDLGGQDDDERAVTAIGRAVPGASVRLDGNAGQTVSRALACARVAEAAGLTVELLEQPGPKDDVAALVTLSRTASVPVIADESVATVDDVIRLADAGVTGVNLKLVKHGGPVMAGRLLRTAQRHSLGLMAGAMVETRVGLSAMLAVVAASVTGPPGTPIAIDLDTAFLLTEDPFVGGYDAVGPRLRLRLDGPRRRTTPTSKPRGP